MNRHQVPLQLHHVTSSPVYLPRALVLAGSPPPISYARFVASHGGHGHGGRGWEPRRRADRSIHYLPIGIDPISGYRYISVTPKNLRTKSSRLRLLQEKKESFVTKDLPQATRRLELILAGSHVARKRKEDCRPHWCQCLFTDFHLHMVFLFQLERFICNSRRGVRWSSPPFPTYFLHMVL